MTDFKEAERVFKTCLKTKRNIIDELAFYTYARNGVTTFRAEWLGWTPVSYTHLTLPTICSV